MGDPSNKPKLNLFAREDCEDLWTRQTRFINSRFKRYSRIINLNGVFTDIMLEESEGTSNRQPTDVDSEKSVYGVARSKISHRLARDNRSRSLEDISNAHRPGHRRVRAGYREFAEEICSRIACQELAKFILDKVRDDPMLSRIVDLWIDDPELKPKEVASKLGISIQELRCAQKRLRRRLSTLRKERIKCPGKAKK